MSEVNDALQIFAEQIYNLLKHRFIDDYEVSRFYDDIENAGFHVDFLGLPYVTTVILYGLCEEKNKLYVKIVDDRYIDTFVFQLKSLERKK